MTIQSVFDPSFSKYGQVLTGYDLTGLLDTLERVTPVPEGTEYVPEQPELMALPVCGELSALVGSHFQLEGSAPCLLS